MSESAPRVQFGDEQPIDEVRERSVAPEGVLLRRIKRFVIEVERDIAASSARAWSRHTCLFVPVLLPR